MKGGQGIKMRLTTLTTFWGTLTTLKQGKVVSGQSSGQSFAETLTTHNLLIYKRLC